MFISQLPYHSDSAALFAHFSDNPYSVFIDSCGLDRFDIIAANPQRVFVTDAEQDAFQLAKDLLIQNEGAAITHFLKDLPFSTGVIGYFSYDLGFKLQQLSMHTDCDLNFTRRRNWIL